MPVRSRQPAASLAITLLSLSLLPGIIRAAGQDPGIPDSLHAPGRVISFEHVNQEIVLKCDVGILVIKPYAENIVHVRYYPGSARATLPLWGFSATASAPKYRVDSTLSAIRLTTSQMTVSVDRKTAQMTFLDQKQNVLLTTRQVHLKNAQVSAEDTHNVHAEFHAPDDEAYYGLGLHQGGWMDQRGKTVRLWQDSQAEDGQIVGIPFLVTNRRYGLVFDNPSKTTVVPGKDGATTWDAEVGEALSYFVIGGNTTDEIFRGYRFLTGAAPLPPKYALGYIQSLMKTRSQDELLQVARRFREKGVPADMLVLNGDTGKVLGDMNLDEKNWPDPAAMNAELDAQGFKTVISCLPLFLKESSNFKALETMGCFAMDKDGKTGIVTGTKVRGSLMDATKAECSSWFWDTIRNNFAARGFAAWWLDADGAGMTPSAFSLHAGKGSRIFNLLPWMQARAIYEGQRRDLKERCLIVTSSAYLGSQQFGTVVRSPGPGPQWEGLKRQIPAGLNAAASGSAYWSSGIGDWQVPAAGGISSEFANPELYTRWFEYGAFCPIFLAHSSRTDGEVWSFGESTERILVKYLRLRYRLLPYIYSQARWVSETGAPFMRALFMDFPQDPEVRDSKDEYMFGPAFLVAPVVEKGQTSREVYLPKGTAWYDYWTGRKYAGGQRLLADAPLDTLPLFVKAGSIIPHGNEIPNSRMEQRDVELFVYTGADGQFDLYHDDGVTYAYEKGKFSLTQLRWSDAAQKMTVTGDDRGLFARPQQKWLKIIR